MPAKKKSETIELGDWVKDVVTGFNGIAIGKHKWLHGCVRWSVQPRELHEGKPVQAHNFDEPQLKLLTKASDIKVATTGSTGGPNNEPSQSRGENATR